MEVLLIIGFSQSLILAGLILMKKQRYIHDLFLSLVFFINGLTLFLGYMDVYNRSEGYPYPFFINLSTPFILLHGPLLWFYIKSLTSQNFRFKTKYLLHFLPFILVSVLLTAGIYSLSPSERIEKEVTEAFKQELTFPVILGLIAASTQGYLIWGILIIGKYRQKIKNYFSNITEKDLKWLRILLVSGIIFYSGISLLYVADFIFSLMPYSLLQPVGFSYAAVYVLVLAYFGHKQGNLFHSYNLKPDLERPPVGGDPEDKIDDEDARFVKDLIKYVKEKKPFLDPEITISSLSDKMNVQPEYLSGILNGKLNRNFYDFINHYRVEEFKRLCHDKQSRSLTIMGMAWDSGFNSKATFNRVFKKATGITPGDYISKCNQ